jgi:hypothetical protein
MTDGPWDKMSIKDKRGTVEGRTPAVNVVSLARAGLSRLASAEKRFGLDWYLAGTGPLAEVKPAAYLSRAQIAQAKGGMPMKLRFKLRMLPTGKPTG